MFYPDRIKSVSPTDRVLEIGPGADPHPRSDILLELRLPGDEDYAVQFGHTRKLQTDKQVVFYDGGVFPFKDKEFDYVICSHVIEHVENVPEFLSEIFRVGRKGYIEYPLITYEYLHNIKAHLNYFKWNGTILHYMKKDDSPLNHFKPVQNFFFSTLLNGYDEFYTHLSNYFFEGFEWHQPFIYEESRDIELYTIFENQVPKNVRVHANDQSAKALIRSLLGKVKRRIRM
jgi:SAM-dependent methyltransferase